MSVSTYYRLEAVLKSGETYKTHTRKPRRHSRLIRTLEWQTVRIHVSYLRGDKLLGTNEGTYANLPDALLAWEAFNDLSIVGEVTQ